MGDWKTIPNGCWFRVYDLPFGTHDTDIAAMIKNRTGVDVGVDRIRISSDGVLTVSFSLEQLAQIMTFVFGPDRLKFKLPPAKPVRAERTFIPPTEWRDEAR